MKKEEEKNIELNLELALLESSFTKKVTFPLMKKIKNFNNKLTELLKKDKYSETTKTTIDSIKDNFEKILSTNQAKIDIFLENEKTKEENIKNQKPEDLFKKFKEWTVISSIEKWIILNWYTNIKDFIDFFITFEKQMKNFTTSKKEKTKKEIVIIKDIVKEKYEKLKLENKDRQLAEIINSFEIINLGAKKIKVYKSKNNYKTKLWLKWIHFFIKRAEKIELELLNSKNSWV